MGWTPRSEVAEAGGAEAPWQSAAAYAALRVAADCTASELKRAYHTRVSAPSAVMAAFVNAFDRAVSGYHFVTRGRFFVAIDFLVRSMGSRAAMRWHAATSRF